MHMHTHTLFSPLSFSHSLNLWGNLLIPWLPITKIMKSLVSMFECLVVVDLLASSLPNYVQPKIQPLEAPSDPSPNTEGVCESQDVVKSYANACPPNR